MIEEITPLEPRKFFSGIWHGEGELIPSRLNAWLVPKEQIRLQSRAVWLSDTIWKVEESFEFSSGKVIERKMFAELIASDRVHITADDMPLGADIILHEKGFSFTPYYILGDFGGRKWRMRCVDDNQLDEHGDIHDKIEMFYFGLRVAEMKLKVRVER
jgi:hypothetical protein